MKAQLKILANCTKNYVLATKVKMWCEFNKIVPSKNINCFDKRFVLPYNFGDFIVAIAPLLLPPDDRTINIQCNTHGEVFMHLENIVDLTKEIEYFTFVKPPDKTWGALALCHDVYDGSDISKIFPISTIDCNYTMPSGIDNNIEYMSHNKLSTMSILDFIYDRYKNKQGFCDIFNVPVCSSHYGSRVEATRVPWDSRQDITSVINECKQQLGLVTYIMNMGKTMQDPWCKELKAYINQPNNLVSILNLPYPLIFMQKNTTKLNFYVTRFTNTNDQCNTESKIFGSLITVILPVNDNIYRDQWKWLSDGN